MNREEVVDLFEFLEINYPSFSYSSKTIDTWVSELQMFDVDDVKRNLKELMAEDLYSKTPPLLSRIIRGLTPKKEKIDFTKNIYFCSRCNRGFNSKEECDEHFNRCSSVDYVIRETRKWFKKELTRKELFAMSDEEFQERYCKLLHWIQNHTHNESDKTRIEFIFKKKKKERAKSFLESR